MAWVFMDLEMKPVDKQFRRQRDICRQEVIEFGAVKLGEDMAEVDSFRRLVKPVYGAIPPRYEQLTGIRNDDVANADDFETVLADFAAYNAACEKADELYQDKKKWARACILNIAGSGYFTSDRTIEEYVQDIWHLEKIKVK